MQPRKDTLANHEPTEYPVLAALDKDILPLIWQHLSNDKQTIKEHGSDADITIDCTRAALRATCTSLRDMSYPLITHLEGLQLGGSGFRDTFSKSAWSTKQKVQYQQAEGFLSRLPCLKLVKCKLQAGGMFMLVKVLEEGCLAQSLTR